MPSQPITEFQFQRLIELTETEGNKFIAERDCLYYTLLLKCGFRPSECRLIKISEIDFNENTIFIPADNNKERHADNFPIPEFLIERIMEYIKQMPFKSEWLFPCFHNQTRKQDMPIHIWCLQRDFTRRMKALGFLHASSFYKDRKRQTHNLNLYSFRKGFGTYVYRKTGCPQKTALLLRQYDRQLKSVWSYVFSVEKEDRGGIIQEIYA